jgi:hypothetical protein
MIHDIHRRNKQLIGKLRAALYDCDAVALRGQLGKVFAADCRIHWPHRSKTWTALACSTNRPTGRC